MLTIHQIAKKTTRLRKEGARYVRFTDIKKGYLSNGNGYIAGASYSTHIIGPDGRPVVNQAPNKYVTVIEFLDRRLHAKVSCSCSDFLYRWEVALNNKEAAEIEYSNGEWPSMTNPQGSARWCKHLQRLYDNIKAKLPSPQGTSKKK